MNDFKISIIIPVYNAELFLAKCLESLINQTMSQIEIICINDGSTDKSGEILDFYARKDGRIRVINQENSGISSARNAGLINSSCPYIMFVDSDDWIDISTCETAYETITRENADIVIWSYIREYSTISKPKIIFSDDIKVFYRTDKNNHEIQRKIIGPIGAEMRELENSDSLAPVWGKLYKANLIRDNNIWFIDTSLIGTAEDALFNVFVTNYSDKIVFINKYFYHYRKDNLSSFTTKYRPDFFRQINILFDQIEEFINQPGIPKEYREALKNRIALSIIGLGLNIVSNNNSTLEKFKMLKNILEAKRYSLACQGLNLVFLPLHWKVFFAFAKIKSTLGIYVLINIIKKKVGR